MADDEASGNYDDFASLGNQSVRRQRTPAVASRVKNASQEDQRSMQAARQQLSFVDGAEEEYESALNENAAAAFFSSGGRGPTATRPKNHSPTDPAAMSASWPAASSVPPPKEEFPDQAMILERLTSIRQHKRQVLDMIDKLKQESGDGEIDRDMLRKLIEAYDNFKEQEEQYLGILQKILALKTQYATSLEDGSISQPEPENAPMAISVKMVRRPQEAIPRPPIMMEEEAGAVDSGFSSATKPTESDELQALVEQRNMLKQMLRQQEELRALQGRHKAQQGQGIVEINPLAPGFDPDLAYQQVHDQQEMLAAKRRELEDLKKKLDYARSFYAETPEEIEEARDVRPAAGAGYRQQHHQLEDKLRVLRGKKQRMDEIINELNALQESTAEDVERQPRPAAMAATVMGGQLPISVNQSGARPKQPMQAMIAPGKPTSRPEAPKNFGMSPNGTGPPEDIRRKLLELEATKSRLAQLQSLVTELEDSGGATIGPNGIGVSPQLLRLVNELEHEDMEPENDGGENPEMSALSTQMRSVYQSKLNEQRDAVEKLQEEHARLTAIKNQLLKLNPLSDPLAAEKAAERAGMEGNASASSISSGNIGRQVESPWRELQQQSVMRDAHQMQRRISESRATPDQRLNNTRDNTLPPELAAINQQRSVRPPAALASAVGSFAAASFLSGDGDELEVEVQRSRRGTDSAGSAIVSNPRLASFRRNNQLDEVQKQHRQQHAAAGPRMAEDGARCQSTPIRGPPGVVDRLLRRRRSSTTIEQQYQQLQQHIDSIRLIFQDLMKEHDESGAQEQQHLVHGDPLLLQQQRMAQAVSAPVTPSWDVLSLGPSAMAVQQHQLMLSLLACQQQLQLQQLEMRYLQQLCQELWHANYNSDGSRTRSGSVNSVNQPQQQGAAAPPGNGMPFGAPNYAPFDGRPLSSASLYNLLAPNPYLTLPYYTPPQFGHNFGNLAARGLSRTNNGNGGVHSLPRGAGVLNNYAGSPANNATTMKSNRNAETSSVGGRAMSSSVVCPDGQHRGASMSDRMIVSDSELSIVGETTSSPFKVGAGGRVGDYGAATANGNKVAVPKLNLEDSYNKSNVNKCHNNKNSNVVVTQTNSVIPELPSRASSTSGAVTNSGCVSVLENGCMTPEQFDLMREVIYSEVATLISQNEQRPSFLLELFRELQLLSNDYLRARALEAIRDILNRYLTDDAEAPYSTDQENDRFAHIRNSTLPGTPSRTITTMDVERDDDHVTRNHHSPNAGALREKPREADAAETTVTLMMEQQNGIDFGTSTSDKPTSRQKRFENLEGIKDVKNLNNAASAGAKEAGEAKDLTISRSQSRDFAGVSGLTSNGLASASGGKVDVIGLEQQIQGIVDELIPFVRGNVDAECSPQLLQYIRKLVLELTTSKCIPPESVSTFFRLQLSSILDDTLTKFRGQKLHECGAELLADVSEVVFNELAFFRLMQNIDKTLVSRHSQGTDSENSTADAETGNTETSESAPLDDVVSETNGERGGSELSSSRQSSLEDELSPMSIHDAVSEVSEDLSAVTAVSVNREADKVASAGDQATVAPDIEIPISGIPSADEEEEHSSPFAKKRASGGHRQSIETVLVAPLMVQVTAATDEEEITTTTNNSSSSINTSSSSSGSQSMHTAGETGSMTSDQVELLKTPPTGGSRENSPPDDIEEVPEQLEQEPVPPTDNNDVTFDLTFEPHPEDQLHLSLSGGQNIHLTVVGAGADDEEEEEGDTEIRRSTTPVMARAVAYLAESTGSAEVTPTEVTNIAGVVSTAN